MIKFFNISSFSFGLEFSDSIDLPENLLLFEIPFADDSFDSNDCNHKTFYRYKVHIVGSLPLSDWQLCGQRDGFRVFKSVYLETRYIGKVGCGEEFYACTIETKEGTTDIFYKEEYLDQITYDTIFCSLLSLERHLLDLGGMILHCAYSSYKGDAILFSAPSGIGKSTQAELWRRHKGSSVVNGDRALLKQDGNGIWYAHGWPVCGSSEICRNESKPVKAIVMLSQARENKVREVKGMEAFRMLYAQITVNSWNVEASTKAMDLLDDLIGKVRIYHLACDISKEAVDSLYNVIFGGEEI